MIDEKNEQRFGTLAKTTLVDRVYEELRLAILRGDIPPGAEINQVALAREFGISRGPIREGLARLHASKLLSVTPYQQYIVRQLDEETVEELLLIREELEVFAVRRRWEDGGSAELLEEARALNDQLAGETEASRWLAIDLDLHRLLCGPTTESMAIIDEVRSRVQQYLATVAGGRARWTQACSEHLQIIDALEREDLERALDAVRNHIGNTRRLLVAAVGGADRPRPTSGGTHS